MTLVGKTESDRQTNKAKRIKPVLRPLANSADNFCFMLLARYEGRILGLTTHGSSSEELMSLNKSDI